MTYEFLTDLLRRYSSLLSWLIWALIINRDQRINYFTFYHSVFFWKLIDIFFFIVCIAWNRSCLLCTIYSHYYVSVFLKKIYFTTNIKSYIQNTKKKFLCNIGCTIYFINLIICHICSREFTLKDLFNLFTKIWYWNKKYIEI
jgi:hypothetical protein